MAKFIELTVINPKQEKATMLVNVNEIITVMPNELAHSIITVQSIDKGFKVEESYTQIKSLILKTIE